MNGQRGISKSDNIFQERDEYLPGCGRMGRGDRQLQKDWKCTVIAAGMIWLLKSDAKQMLRIFR